MSWALLTNNSDNSGFWTGFFYLWPLVLDLPTRSLMKKSLSYCLFLLLGWGQLAAQGGVGILDLDLVLEYMPETQTMQRELQIFERRKVEELQPLSDSIRLLGQQLRQQQQSGLSQDLLQPYIAQLDSMESRLEAQTLAAQQASAFREELFLDEIRAKFDRHLAALCEEQGFTYVFNARAAGNSTLLRSTEGSNITLALLRHMRAPIGEDNLSEEEENNSSEE